jgi:hypothetical protein
MRADAPTPEVERELEAIDAATAGRRIDDAALALLVADLQAERPEIDPFFARELDGRAAAGFPREPRRTRMRVMLFPALGVAATAMVAVVIALAVNGSNEYSSTLSDSGAGGSAGGASSGGAESAGGGGSAASTAAPQAGSAAPAPSALRQAQRPKSVSSGGVTGADLALAVPAAPGQASPRADSRRARKVETSASLTLVSRPDRISGVADGVVRVTDALGGFVVSSTVSSTDGGGGGTFELRVPSARLQRALAELSRLAHVQERAQATQDITAESVSATDRLQEARAERRSLLRRLARATTDAETASLRGRLRDVSARIAAAKASLARVNNRASFSTVTVTLASDSNAAAAGDDGRWTPADAARDAVRVLEAVLGGALIGLAVLLPLAILAALGMVTTRAAGRRRRERALDAAV